MYFQHIVIFADNSIESKYFVYEKEIEKQNNDLCKKDIKKNR